MAASRNRGPLERTRVPQLRDGTSNLSASPLTGPVGRQSAHIVNLKEKRRTLRAHLSLPTLRKGSQGSDVRWLQTLLNQHKAPYSSLKVDGNFGPKTVAAVVAFQQGSSLSADGVVGLETWSKVLLFEDTIRKKPPLPTVFTLASLRAPEPPQKVSDAPVADWSLRLRFEEVLRLAPNHMAPQLAAQFRAMLTPLNIGIMVTTLAAWAVSHAFGVGEVADIVMAVLGAVFLGLAAFKAGEDLGECLGITLEARSEPELDEAADYLAQAIAILGVVAFFALIAKVGAKVGGAAGAAEEEAAGGAAESSAGRAPRARAAGADEGAGAAKPKPAETPAKAEPAPKGVVFSGHGHYLPENGTVVVPEGTSITVYSEHGATITDSLGNAVETKQDVSNVFQKTYGPGSEMPNYTLSPPKGLNIKGDPVTVDSPKNLSDLLEPGMGDCRWAACTYDPAGPGAGQTFTTKGVIDSSSKQFIKIYGDE